MKRAKDVAEWFLKRNYIDADGCKDNFLTPMQLQKLLYYAQGYFVGCYGRPLFSDAIKAWKWGPVVPPVYNAYKKFEGRGIEVECNCRDEDFAPEELRTLDIVYDLYSKFSGVELSRMTHSEMPWKTTEPLAEIPLMKLQDFFEDSMITEQEEKELEELKIRANALGIHPFNAEPNG